MNAKQEAFLVALTELTRLHGIAVDGCGCCGSPNLKEVATNGDYSVSDNGEFVACLEWKVNTTGEQS